MSENIKIGLHLTWLILIAYWLISGFRAKKVKSQESFFSRFFQYWLPLIAAALLLGPGEWFGHSLIRENFVPHSRYLDQQAIMAPDTQMERPIMPTRLLCGTKFSLIKLCQTIY